MVARRAAIASGQAVKMQVPARAILSTWDESARTVDLIIATDAPLLRTDYSGDCWEEQLACAPNNVIISRANSGRMSITIDHDDVAGESDTVVGLVVENSVRFEQVDGANGVIVTARINRPIDGDAGYNRFITLFERGFLPNVSVWPNAHHVTIAERQGLPDLVTATLWEPMSASFVATPADANCAARSFSAIAENPPIVQQVIESRQAQEPPMEIVQVPAVVEFGDDQRIAIAVRRASALKLPTDELIAATVGAKSEAEATEKVVEFLAARSEKSPARHGNIEVGTSAKEHAIANTIAGIAVRAGQQVGMTKPQSRDAECVREFAEIQSRGAANSHLTAIQQVRRMLVQNGDSRANDAGDQEIARGMLGLPGGYQPRAGTITTSDLASLAANLATKTLVPMLREQFFPFEKYCRSIAVKDYKLQYPVTFDGIGNLISMPENGAYQETTLSDSKESFKVSKKGLKVSISDVMLMADDLGALRETPTKLMQAASRTRVADFFAFLLANANLSDGNALFSAAHSNVITPYAAADTTAAIDAARVILASQVGKKGEILELSPWSIMVGQDVLTGAQRATGRAYAPVTVATAVPEWAGNLLVDGAVQLSGGTTWYMFADPGQFPLLTFATLQNATQNGMLLKSRVNFDTDSFEITLADAYGFGASNSSGNGAVRVKTI